MKNEDGYELGKFETIINKDNTEILYCHILVIPYYIKNGYRRVTLGVMKSLFPKYKG